MLRAIINNKPLSGFASWEVTADINAVADTFTFTGSDDALLAVNPGDWVTLKMSAKAGRTGPVNATVMRGCVTAVDIQDGPDGKEATVSGVDVCGLLDIAQIERYKTISGAGILAVAEMLTAGLNWKNKIRFTVDGAEPSTRKKLVLEPGRSIADALYNLAVMRGLTMWAEPDGTIVFGKISASQTPDCELNHGKDCILSSSLSTSIHDGGSRISARWQNEEKNDHAEIKTVGFPDIDLPVCVDMDSDGDSAKSLVAKRCDEVRRKLFEYSADVQGFADSSGKLWTINKICRVVDTSIKPIDKNLLIVARTFSYSNDAGSKTKLVLSVPELV